MLGSIVIFIEFREGFYRVILWVFSEYYFMIKLSFVTILIKNEKIGSFVTICYFYWIWKVIILLIFWQVLINDFYYIHWLKLSAQFCNILC